MPDQIPYRLYSTDQEIVLLAAALRNAKQIAVDTEFMGEGRYFPLLCFVQIASDLSREVALLDPMSIRDTSPLRDVFDSTQRKIIMHAGRQDVSILHDWLGVDVYNSFDTQVAASFLGYGDQAALSKLLQDVLGIRLEKGERFTDWSQRPLKSSQLLYAASDVVDLLALANRLEAELVAKARLEWFVEEMEFWNRSTERLGERELWRRVGERRGLKRKDLAVLRELAMVREDISRKRNKPREFFIPDRVLVQMTRVNPNEENCFARLRGWRGNVDNETQQALKDAIQRGTKVKPADYPEEESGTPAPPECASVADLLSAWMKRVALHEEISTPLLAVRSELDELAKWSMQTDAKLPNIRMLTGWRRKLIGNDMIAIASGDAAVGTSQQAKQIYPIL